MRFLIAVVVIGVGLLSSACTTLPTIEDRSRASSAASLGNSNSAKSTAELLDRDLFRESEFRGEDYIVETTLLSGALLDAMVSQETSKLGYNAADKVAVLNQLKKKFVEGQTCFDIMVRTHTFLNDEIQDAAILSYYDISYSIPRSPTVRVPAKSQEDNHDDWQEVRALRDLLNRYLPTAYSEGNKPRNLRGYGKYTREIVCGKPVAAKDGITLVVTPRWNAKFATHTLEWKTAPQAVPAR